MTDQATAKNDEVLFRFDQPPSINPQQHARYMIAKPATVAKGDDTSSLNNVFIYKSWILS